MSTVQQVFSLPQKVDLTVFVFQRPNMRDSSLEFELQMGRGFLENIFDHMVIDETETDMYFSFPENHLNIIEQRLLYPRLGYYYPNLEKVTIKTQSVYIIQCTPAANVRIVRHEDYVNKPLPGEHDENGRINKTGPTWEPMVMSLLSSKSLNVLSSKL